MRYVGVDRMGSPQGGTIDRETAEQFIRRMYAARWVALIVVSTEGRCLGGIDRQHLRRGRAWWIEGGEPK